MSAARIMLAARLELLDLRRQARVIRLVVLLPLAMNLFFVLGPNVITRLTTRHFERTTYTVAIDRSIATQTDLLERLRGARLRTQVRPDPRRAVLTKRADAALVATAPVPSDLVQEGQLTAKVYALSSRQRSRVGATALVAALRTYGETVVRQRVAALGIEVSAAKPIVVTDQDLLQTPAGNRLGLSTLLPIAVLYPMVLVLGTIAGRLGGSKDERTVEALRTLPMTNAEQITAKAVVGLGLTALAAPTIIVPLIFASAVLPGGVQAFGSPWRVVPVAALALVCLSLLHVAMGLCMGAFARTKEELSALTVLSNIPFFAIAISNAVRPGQAPEGPFLALPVFGPLLLLRAAIVHPVSAGQVSLALVSSVVWSIVLFAGAARFFGTDRSVLRAST